VQEVSDGHGLQLTSTKYRCWIDVDPATARDYTKELADKKLAQEKVIAQLKARLENKAYADNAPKEVVEQSKQQLAEAEELLAKLSKEFERFSDYLGN
jgi:valyl-tRNA synthetase